MTHRFINADGLVSTGTGILGHNMFAYCDNNPVNCSDASGMYSVFDIIKNIVKTIRVSLMMLKHSIIGNGKSQTYGATSIVSETLSKSQIMQNEINKNITCFKESNKTNETYYGSVSLYGNNNVYDFDLSYSVGKASYVMSVSRETKTTGFWIFEKTKTRYIADVVVTDIYDFDEYREDGSLGSILNNWGYDMQQQGFINPFAWDASFSYYSNWSES